MLRTYLREYWTRAGVQKHKLSDEMVQVIEVPTYPYIIVFHAW